MGHCRLESFIHCSKNRYLYDMYLCVQAFVFMCQDFFLTIFGRGPRAFQIGTPLNWEICYSAQLCHFWSIKK